jgi:hypothetical protein
MGLKVYITKNISHFIHLVYYFTYVRSNDLIITFHFIIINIIQTIFTVQQSAVFKNSGGYVFKPPPPDPPKDQLR